MRLVWLSVLLLSSVVFGELFNYANVKGKPYTVTYDHRSFLINGSRVLLLGGSVHYPRSTPAMWPKLFDLAIQNGLNTIETYVFWNFHEAVRGEYDFSGRGDLVQFIEQAAQHNLFVNLRIGPFIGGEWFYGGFPLWLKYIPGIEMRAFNKPFITEMANFVSYIVDLVGPNLPSQGGNVIISQIENEYHSGDNDYVNWCGSFVETLDIGIPWMMCNGQYANNTIDACNGCYCDGYVQPHWQSQPNMPAAWTENEGWYDQWGKANLKRNTDDLAYSVARYVAMGGSYHNYYMWHGGNNYGWTSAASVTTAYANDVMVDSMALPHEPKFSFLGALHNLLHNYSTAILSQNPPSPSTVNGSVDFIDYGEIGFLSNYGSSATVAEFSGQKFFLPPNTVIILNAQKATIFNTSAVSNIDVPHNISVAADNLQWSYFTEPIGPTLPNVFKNPTPLDQLFVSEYGDYTWYSTVVNLSSDGNLAFTSSVSQVYSLFVDDALVGVSWDFTKSSDLIQITVDALLSAGSHKIDILCSSLGLDSNGINAQTFMKGIAGNVFIGTTNITQPSQGWWTMQGELVGEALEIYTPSNIDLVTWTPGVPQANSAITWFSTKFATPTIPGTVAIDFTGAGKGIAYVNGNSIGRYWTLPGECSGDQWCAYFSSDCTTPTQTLYHIPPDWLTTSVNTLVLFEELGGIDLTSVKIVVVA